MTDMISTSIRLSPELHRRIKKAAHRCEQTQTEFITHALETASEATEPQLSYHALQCEKQNEQGFADREERV